MTRDENHHAMYRKTIDGVTHIVTRISHHSHPIDSNLGSRMGKQCYLQLKEFWQLVDCTLTAEAWDALVRQRCVDGRNPFF